MLCLLCFVCFALFAVLLFDFSKVFCIFFWLILKRFMDVLISLVLAFDLG